MTTRKTQKTPAPKTTKAQAKAPKKATAKVAAREEEEEDEEASEPRSVVSAKYKARYRERGNPRNCGDWLAAVLAEHVLTEEHKLDVAKLQQIAVANNVSPEYSNRTKGWEGRMRMTIGLRMRPVVAAEGTLYIPHGKKRDKLAAPREWAAKHIR